MPRKRKAPGPGDRITITLPGGGAGQLIREMGAEAAIFAGLSLLALVESGKVSLSVSVDQRPIPKSGQQAKVIDQDFF